LIEQVAPETSLSAGFPHFRIYWGMERAIFDKSAADWMILLRSKSPRGDSV
jgi:hypothetical protein